MEDEGKNKEDKHEVESILGIPSSHRFGSTVLVSRTWMAELVSRRQLPPKFPEIPNCSAEEIEALLKDGKPFFKDQTWQTLTLVSVQRSRDPVCALPKMPDLDKIEQDPDQLCFAEVLQYVAESNFVNCWRDAHDSWQKTREDQSQLNRPNSSTLSSRVEKDSAVLEVMMRLHGEDLLIVEKSDLPNPIFHRNKCQTLPATSHIHPIVVVVIDENFIHILKPHLQFSLFQALSFSPAFFATSSYLKLFVVYQILLAMKDLHLRKLAMGDITLHDIFIDHEGLVFTTPRLEANILSMPPQLIMDPVEPIPPQERLIKLKRDFQKAGHNGDETILIDYLGKIVTGWRSGSVSNFDYIMCLNILCGRNLSNPNHYPVFPWVHDFSSEFGGWRDLSKSKFRLNKGDAQLDLTYSSLSDSRSPDDSDATGQGQVAQVPHHVSDILSDITYYVYKARRTPKSVLCKHVRTRWVPAEYPSSMKRLQEWTPDECIPEFFTDPDIFKTIHDDLSDLEIPNWCGSPEEFIEWHRSCLESDKVSQSLHHWIDLTFGCKLSGSAAIKAKNVVLGLVDNHKGLKHSGVVQLFQEPHPARISPSYYWSKDAPKFRGLQRGEQRPDDLERTRRGPSSVSDPQEDKSAIVLPIDFDPLAKIQDIENLMKFLNSIGCHLQPDDKPEGDNDVILRSPPSRQLTHQRTVRDMQNFACVVMELIFPEKFRHLGRHSELPQRFQVSRNLLKNHLFLVPYNLREMLKTLLDHEFTFTLDDKYPALNDAGLPPVSPYQLLIPQTSSLYFPPSFKPYAKAVRNVHSIQLAARFSDKVDAEVVNFTGEFNVKFVACELQPAIAKFCHEEIKLIKPLVVKLLKEESTCIFAAWILFDPVAKYMSIADAKQSFLAPLLDIYEGSSQTSKHLKLYHRTFLQFLLVRFGTSNFLKYFSTYLIEAVGGYKDYLDDRSHREGLEKSWRVSESSSRPGSSLDAPEPRPVSQSSTDNNSHEEESFAEGDIFSFDSTSLHEVEDRHPGRSHDGQVVEEIYIPPLPILNSESDVIKMASEHLRQKKNSGNISQVASESVLWLTHRLGPVLTSKFLARNLLRMLNLCYMESNSFVATTDAFPDALIRLSRQRVQGDGQVQNVLDCLADISCLYGYHVILLQYLPYTWEVVSMARKKLTFNLEAGLVGIMSLLHQILPYLSDSLLMRELPDGILANIIFPTLQIFTSRNVAFQGGWTLRRNLAHKFLDTLYLIGLRIGEEMSRSQLTSICTALFSSYDKVYDRSGQKFEIDGESQESREVGHELQRVLSPDYAYASYLAFYNLMGRNHLESSIVNLDLIKTLCLLQQRTGGETVTRPASFSSLQGQGPSSSLSPSSGGNKVMEVSSSAGGNSLLIPQDDSTQNSNSPHLDDLHLMIFKDINTPNARHLKGNWLAYWEHEIGRGEKDTRFNLKQIKLQNFIGHSSSVKALHVLNNENSFLSGSRDKTAKVWSLRSQGDGNANVGCQWTYASHKKSVFSVSFLDSLGLAVSCDSAVHVWDPFIGSGVHQVDSQRIGAIHVMTQLPAPYPVVIGASQDSLLHLIDCRIGNVTANLKVSLGYAGLVRSLCPTTDGNYVIVGHSSGFISCLDLRSGKIRQNWKAHEGEVMNITILNDENQFISSSLDQTVSVWDYEEARLVQSLTGSQEPVHCVTYFPTSETIVTGTTGNRIGVRHGTTNECSFQSTRLRSDIVKGSLSVMKGLPMNHLLLLGQDNGAITLLC